VDLKSQNNRADRKLDNLTDCHLVEKVLGGDTHSFGAIIKNTEGLVAAIILKMIPNTEDRKDLVQDIYLKTFHKLSGFNFQSKLSTWIGKITYNTCLSWLEKKKLVLPGDAYGKDDDQATALEILSYRSSGAECEGAGSDAAGSAAEPLIRKELSGILQAEIERLPPVYRTLVCLYHQEELSYEEMGQITGLPEGTVKSYLFRARKQLKETLLSKYKKEAL
jgi:RNA polymerase sigma factor (sigma-70 family)